MLSIADYMGNNLYWTDAERATIEILSLRTRQQAIVYHYMKSGKPIALTVLPEHGQMVVAVQNMYGHTHFARMALNGLGDYHHVMETGVGIDHIQLVHDTDSDQIFWLDGELQKIMFSDYERMSFELWGEIL